MFTEKDSQKITQFMEEVNQKAADYPDWIEIFNNSFLDTLQNTVERLDDGTLFVITGDIPAMWLRDSTAQIRPYLFLANDNESIRSLIKGLIERHFQLIQIDPYANAFNREENHAGHQDDGTDMQPIIWERKYEVDSLCYPIQLAYLYYKQTGDTSQFNETFKRGIETIVDVWTTEQHHENSSYVFERDTTRVEWNDKDTLDNNGKGSPVAYTGMTWSGFRPSDDRCTYHYLIPSNMFAVVVLGYLAEILTDVLIDEELLERVIELRNKINTGIKEFGMTRNAENKEVYAFEVDGYGNYLLMDDANIPSLLSAPYLGYCEITDPLYQATRKTILSEANPYYYRGRAASGIGSPHTPKDYIWHLSLAMEGLTSKDKEEKERILQIMAQTDGGKKFMHESFHKDDPTKYTREWFSWPNMLFCELMLDYLGYHLKGAETQNENSSYNFPQSLG